MKGAIEYNRYAEESTQNSKQHFKDIANVESGNKFRMDLLLTFD